MKQLFWILIALLGFYPMEGQKYGYEVRLEPVNISGIGGLQSYSFGTHADEWLIVGGRLDGLHQRQPFASFNRAGNNDQIMVVNPITQEIWTKKIDELPTNLKEQLSSTNMQFYQWGENLILTGGYAFSKSKDDHITFPYLTLIDVPQLIEAIKNDLDIANSFYQIEDEKFCVAGGRLEMIDDVFYLVGGHKFMGRYNPMGPNHGPGFSQIYTHEIRKFELVVEDKTTIKHLPTIHDELHLRRRDYNLVPILNDGKKELMVFSGVFQKNANLPWLYPVRITSENYYPIENFQQHYNHYHCASLSVYNKSVDEMHSLFFGGIAQFYMEDNMVVQDNDVPFVNTITDVIRSEGRLVEIPMKQKMSELLGAGAELILNSQAPVIDDGIIDGDAISGAFKEIGYIYGGIASDAHNIFWVNTGAESKASSIIYKVSIRKKESLTFDELSIEESTMLIYPNPNLKSLKMGFTAEESLPISVEIFDLKGNKIGTHIFPSEQISKGSNFLEYTTQEIDYGAYIYHIKIGDKTIKRKVVWTE